MSQTSGNFLGLLKKATFGTGKGEERVRNDINVGSNEYNDLYSGKDEMAEDRKKGAQKMVATFYDLVTDFYEQGWGQSFHFAPRGPCETFRESIVRHEHYIASKLNMCSNDYVIDIGCGIGGPMRNICQFSYAKIVGVTINQYQVERGNTICKSNGLSHLCELQNMDFTNLKFEENTFDKAFSIEATCHAPDRTAVFSEAFRVLKPGGLFATYEWVLTDKYDSNNSNHVKWRQMVEKGNALPELVTDKQSIADFKKVGFEIIECEDIAQKCKNMNATPWYASMQAGFTLETLAHTRLATFLTDKFCYFMEKLKLAPKGTHATHQVLITAKDGLVAAGIEEIFTPMLLIVGRKPSK